MEEKLYQIVVDYIKEEIHCNRLKIGNKLPTERELSVSLGLSRNSIREALRTLSSLGIIESRQGSGNYLAGNITQFFSESFKMITLVNKTTPKEICQMRQALEMQAFLILVTSLTPEQIETLYQKARKMEGLDIKKRPQVDLAFHKDIIELSGNSLMTSTYEALSAVFLENIRNGLKILSPENLENTQQLHLDLVTALRDHDIDAGLKAITRHYSIVINSLE